jgi:predicted SnoaL-like aldol condensation-catalyzing enzyme
LPSDYKPRIVELLKSWETGDSQPFAHINPDKLIQHNPRLGDGLAAYLALSQSLPRGSVKVNVVRVFQDGDIVFAHTERIMARPEVTFDIFRFEDGKIVEHWDNIQDRAAKPNPSGHAMTDGPTEATDFDKTEENKELIRAYRDDVIQGRRESAARYFDDGNYIQHNPVFADNSSGLTAGVQALESQGLKVKFDRVHMVLGEGNFVLVVTEGSRGDLPTAYYDLFRIENRKIAEHWDTIEQIPPASEWKNSNGKFWLAVLRSL